MRLACLLFALALSGASPAQPPHAQAPHAELPHGQPPQAGPPPADDLEAAAEIVVTGRRGSAAPKPGPIDYYRTHCFEAVRRMGRPLAPTDEDRDWAPLGDAARRQLRISDPATPAFDLIDEARGHMLILKLEHFSRPHALEEIRCTLVVVGGKDHARLEGGMAALFRSPGTERHVGHAAGVDKVAGWRQWAWTGMPDRRSRNWRGLTGSGAAKSRPSFLVVTDPASFYNSYDYIAGELKTRQAAPRPLSVLSFSYTHRPDRAEQRRRTAPGKRSSGTRD